MFKLLFPDDKKKEFTYAYNITEVKLIPVNSCKEYFGYDVNVNVNDNNTIEINDKIYHVDHTYTVENDKFKRVYTFKTIGANYIKVMINIIETINFTTITINSGSKIYCVYVINNNYNNLYYSVNCNDEKTIGKNHPDINNCLILQKEYDNENNVEECIYINYVRALRHCFNDPNSDRKLDYLMDIVSDIGRILGVKKYTLIDKATFNNKLTACYVNFLLGKQISIYYKYGFKYKTDNAINLIDIDLNLMQDDRTNELNYINKISINDIISDIQEINGLSTDYTKYINDSYIINSRELKYDSSYQEQQKKINKDVFYNTIKIKPLIYNELAVLYQEFISDGLIKNDEILYFDELYKKYLDSIKNNNNPEITNKYLEFIKNIIYVIEKTPITLDILNSGTNKLVGQYGFNLYTLHKCFRKIDQLNDKGMIKIVN